MKKLEKEQKLETYAGITATMAWIIVIGITMIAQMAIEAFQSSNSSSRTYQNESKSSSSTSKYVSNKKNFYVRATPMPLRSSIGFGI